MKKLYTEKQYKEYSDLMEKMANTDDILEGFHIHLEIDQWLADSKLSELAIEQMDKRMEKEDFEMMNNMENNKNTKNFKVIEFPKPTKKKNKTD